MILLEGRKQDVNALAFSPDGKQLAVAGTASHVQLWDLQTRTVIAPTFFLFAAADLLNDPGLEHGDENL